MNDESSEQLLKTLTDSGFDLELAICIVNAGMKATKEDIERDKLKKSLVKYKA